MEGRRTRRIIGVLVALLTAWTVAGAEAETPLIASGRVAPGASGEPGESWLEDRWSGRFELAEVELRPPYGDGTLAEWDHLLRVALLTEEGTWDVALELPIGPQSLPAPEPSPLTDDQEALDFLQRVGMPLEQLEFFLGTPMAASLPTVWLAQGIAREEIPDSLLRLLEGDPAPADAARAPAGAGPPPSGGWSHERGALVFLAPLPDGVLARGVRFSLVGDTGGGGWRLTVRGVPIPDDVGFRRREWRYTHVW